MMCVERTKNLSKPENYAFRTDFLIRHEGIFTQASCTTLHHLKYAMDASLL